MFIGEIIGTVVSTRKTDNMQGLTLRLVRRLNTEGQPSDAYVVAVDMVGADQGEVVLVATGSSARQTHLTDKRPCDAVVMAIVDTWQIDRQVKFAKA